MLLLQFVFIIVDRALYLRKNLVGKIIFQFITVIGMHVWLFFLVPVFSERYLSEMQRLMMFYNLLFIVWLFNCFTGVLIRNHRQLFITLLNVSTSYFRPFKFGVVIRVEFWAIV